MSGPKRANDPEGDFTEIRESERPNVTYLGVVVGAAPTVWCRSASRSVHRMFVDVEKVRRADALDDGVLTWQNDLLHLSARYFLVECGRAAVLAAEAHVGQYVVLGRVRNSRRIRQLGPILFGDLSAPSGMCQAAVHESHTAVLSGGMQQVVGVVPLPTRAAVITSDVGWLRNGGYSDHGVATSRRLSSSQPGPLRSFRGARGAAAFQDGKEHV